MSSERASAARPAAGLATGPATGLAAEPPAESAAGPATDPGSDPGADPALELARRCARVMWDADPASRGLGMELVDVGPGRSRLTMTVRPDMVNGHGVCHGGLIATLADSAFAFACNTYDDVTVAAGFTVEFVSPAREGDALVAVGQERTRRGRSGVYDVTVSRADGGVVAEYRGRSHALGRPMIEDPHP